jgi:hypothetical protein
MESDITYSGILILDFNSKVSFYLGFLIFSVSSFLYFTSKSMVLFTNHKLTFLDYGNNSTWTELNQLSQAVKLNKLEAIAFKFQLKQQLQISYASRMES